VAIINLKTFGKKPNKQAVAQLKKSPYYRKRGFAFMGTKPNAGIGIQIAKAYAKSSKKERSPNKKIPIVNHTKNDFAVQPSQRLKIMWLGHASLLIELMGKRILVDPVFCQRPSPTQFAGPAKRFHPTPFTIKNMPAIDYILISHNHYDHLDYDFIKAIRHLDIQYLLPLGLSSTLKYWGVHSKNLTELGWHESKTFGGIQFTAADAKHYSGRNLRDTNSTFWNSYIISSSGQNMFISGDSGYIEAYKKIGKQYGPFDVAAIAIGAYHKLWPDNHKTPEEAWQAKTDINTAKMLPVHWATFDLALHPWAEPAERLVVAAGSKTNELLLPKIGEWVAIDNYKSDDYWWR